MADEVRIWQIKNGNKLQQLPRSKLDLEERLEQWLNKDISVLSEDLLIIDRQTKTDFGDFIDLLCLNRTGDIVVVELKRDKTPRQVTAQALDYASWVKDLSREAILNIADKYLALMSLTLEEAFSKRFGTDLPDVLNDSQHDDRRV